MAHSTQCCHLGITRHGGSGFWNLHFSPLDVFTAVYWCGSIYLRSFIVIPPNFSLPIRIPYTLLVLFMVTSGEPLCDGSVLFLTRDQIAQP